MDELKQKCLTLAQELQELFQCPVCLDSLDVLHWLCKNGHGVCSSCRSNLKSCPTCERKFVICRPTLTNQLLERLPKPCSFAVLGCPEVLFSKGHEQYCEFRQTWCRMKDCEWIGSVKSVLEHLQENHKVHLPENSTESFISCHHSTFSLAEDFSRYSTIMFKNNVFWLLFDRDSSTRSITFRFHYFPTKKPTHDYYFIVSLKKGVMEFTTTSKALIDVGVEFASDNKEWVYGPDVPKLVIPDSEFDKILEDGHKLNFTINIVEVEISDS
ncbi:Siah2p [Homalodisca vitripennis]|nr:Siah2p [Homalodisca vitripennis]